MNILKVLDNFIEMDLFNLAYEFPEDDFSPYRKTGVS